MFDFESKIAALANNYGLEVLLMQSEVTEEAVIKLLVEEGHIDLDDYFNLDAEYEAWERMEE